MQQEKRRNTEQYNSSIFFSNKNETMKRKIPNSKVEQANKMTFITHGFPVSVISDIQERVRDLASPLHFMLRRSSLVECVRVLHGTCLQ
jgi:hypothetical protein